MKYVILIHSNPQPWGHPTSNFLAEHQALSEAERERAQRRLRGGDAGPVRSAASWSVDRPSATRTDARLFRWSGGRRKITDGPYAETVEQFAGFFLIDVASQERAEEVAEKFAGPGETVELRPVAE